MSDDMRLLEAQGKVLRYVFSSLKEDAQPVEKDCAGSADYEWLANELHELARQYRRRYVLAERTERASLEGKRALWISERLDQLADDHSEMVEMMA